jgi:hypothetical protein
MALAHLVTGGPCVPGRPHRIALRLSKAIKYNDFLE